MEDRILLARCRKAIAALMNRFPGKLENGVYGVLLTDLETRLALYNPDESPEYEAFVESMVQHCHCRPPFDGPCAGVLAGGLCDDMGTKENEDPDYRNAEKDDDY